MSEAAFSLKGNDETFRERRHLHGRRVGRPLKSNQAELLATRLPALRIDPTQPPPAQPAALFPIPVEGVWLEIGFGAGEHLLWQAGEHPEIGLIGCEPFVNGVAKAVRGVDEAGLRTVRLYDDDARHLLDWLPPASIGRVFVLFPDPWPKKRHRKRRILTDEGLALLARVMKPGAELRFATDIADYAEMVVEGIDASAQFESESGLLPERPADWPLTRYAEKAIAAGRACEFFVFRRS
ncbi:MAG: tRNA (guanosine(46)-N7)-methyltransferase TrmB [Rhodomicrobiaceae bacterium]